MLRKSLSAFGCCMLLAYTALSQIVGETDQYRLNGPIKSVRVEKATISDKGGKSSEGPRVLSSEYIFDSKGRLIESLICNYDGSPYAKYQAIYNDTGKVEETYHKPKGDLIDKMAYSYGHDGRLIEKNVEKARKSPKSKSVFSYDERGRIKEKVHENTKDGGFKLVYSYDDAQGSIEETAYDMKKGTRTSRATYKYDKQWRLVEKEFSVDTGSSDLAKCNFVYDADGNIVEETFHILGGVNKWRYEYQADSHNNWTKRITLSLVNRNGTLRLEPVEATYRTLTYNAGSSEHPVANAADLGLIVVTKETNSYLQGEAVKRQQPLFPEDAKRQRLGGTITVYVLVDESGRVISARAKPSQAESLRGAATFAAWDWKFNPIVSGGIAVKLVGPVTFNFSP